MPPSPPLGLPPFLPPSLPPPKRIEREKKIKVLEQGYDSFVKRKLLKIKKGKFKSRGFLKLNKNSESLTKSVALNRAMRLADRFTNRSIKIKKSKIPPNQSTEKLNMMLRNKFRPSKSKNKPNVLVEKSKFAIDSIEEKRGIPLRAAELRRLGLLETKKRRKKRRSRTQQPQQSFGFGLLAEPRRKRRRRGIQFF